MSYEEHHKISNAWIKALEWQCTYERWGDLESAARWERKADKLKAKLLSMGDA